jgi:hypothetical protein
MGAYSNLTAGGYPSSTVATGFVTATIDANILPILEAQETASGNLSGLVNFTLKNFSIETNSALTWVVINEGTEIPFSQIYQYNNNVVVWSLVFKTAVEYRIAYNY